VSLFDDIEGWVIVGIILAVVAIIGYALYDATIDRGRCLRSHVATSPMWVQVIPNGTIIHPAYDYAVCDEWEFPNGKPEKEL